MLDRSSAAVQAALATPPDDGEIVNSSPLRRGDTAGFWIVTSGPRNDGILQPILRERPAAPSAQGANPSRGGTVVSPASRPVRGAGFAASTASDRIASTSTASRPSWQSK